MTLPAQRAGWASPCDTQTRVNVAQLAALGKGLVERREGWMEEEQGEQFRRVVRRQRAVWSSVVTQ